jgi:hypothetical protein
VFQNLIAVPRQFNFAACDYAGLVPGNIEIDAEAPRMISILQSSAK